MISWGPFSGVYVCGSTHHFVINFVEVNFTNFIYDIFALERDEAES